MDNGNVSGVSAASPSTEPFATGTVAVGANYWASHAGVFMWRDWRPEVVAMDFKRLAATGVQVLRVFPLWPDFQPIHALRKEGGVFAEYRHGERPLAGPGDEGFDVGEDGVSREMLARFGLMADFAREAGISLVVALVTGWMSGRLFVPPALERLNPITDPVAIQWEVRFVRAFVERHRQHPAIVAWDLGNECNCMGPATREQAWVWTATIAGAIRSADATRPVISGMHSLGASPGATWSIRDQGEITDILTTHPYALFTPHCDREPINTMRPLLHAAAETCLYADLSGRPAMVEEFGTLGPMICGDAVAADMARVRVYDAWAHDARAALWWCASDQAHLEHAPYDWNPVERELGLLREDGSAKPVAAAFKAAREAIAGLPVATLPGRRIDAVCLLTDGQDSWAAAFTTFILAKQAGFDVRFHTCERAIPDARFYLLPSVKGLAPLSRRRERELWAKVEAGATLYVSLDDGVLGEFHAHAGLEIAARERRAEPCRFVIGGERLALNAPVRYVATCRADAEVLLAEEDGAPVLIKARHGRGTVYSLLAPVESALAAESGAFAPGRMGSFWKLYALAGESALSSRVVRKTSPWLGVTEHRLPDGSVVAVMTNYSNGVVRDTLRLAEGAALAEVWIGPAPDAPQDGSLSCVFAAASTAVWRVRVART